MKIVITSYEGLVVTSNEGSCDQFRELSVNHIKAILENSKSATLIISDYCGKHAGHVLWKCTVVKHFPCALLGSNVYCHYQRCDAHDQCVMHTWTVLKRNHY